MTSRKPCKDCAKEKTYSLRNGRCSWCDKKARNDDPDGAKQKARQKRYVSRAGYHRIHLLARYGLTPEKFELMRAKQHNKCQICLIAFTKTPHVDHDHATGQVRGLLCGSCNKAIGGLLEDEFRLSRSIAYLRHYGKQPAHWTTTRFVDLPERNLDDNP